jgi:hypothetical protein
LLLAARRRRRRLWRAHLAECTPCAEGARRSATTCAQQSTGGKVAQAGR